MERRDWTWMVLFLILGAAGLSTFVRYYNDAFPVASLDFKLSREEAYQKSEAYLQALGHNTDAFESAQIFGQSGIAQIFLERTLGLAEANRLARDWVSIWNWRIRWFQPLEKEELRVHLDPGGRIVYFQHHILESDPGASLTQEEARPIADAFLQTTQGFDLSNYEPIEKSSIEREARIDHTFTYRKNGFTIGDDGHYRLAVTVQGESVGGFVEYLKVPESWSRNYQEIRSRANLLAQIFNVFWMALTVAMLVVIVQKYRQGTLNWRGATLIGMLVAAATLIGSINSLPLTRFGYNTTQSYASFMINFLFIGILGATVGGGIICLTGASGGVLAREVLYQNRRNPLARLSFKHMFSGGFAHATLVGYGLAFTHLGYVTLFYILGNEYLGVWSPARVVEYNNTFSTFLPWIYPLITGLVASTTEEFFFRLLAIPLLIRLIKKPWLAVLLQAIVWGFLHANYPQEPIYIRGLELTVVGIIFGVVFLRFGIWATVISHYVYNAFLGVYPMIQSSSLYFQVSGILVVGVLLIPTVPALFSLITGKPQEIEDEEEEPPPEPAAPPPAPEPQETIVRKEPEAYLLNKKELTLAGIIALVGLVLTLTFQVDRFGKRNFALKLTRGEAIEKAEAFRKTLGLDLEAYRRVAWFSNALGADAYTHLVRKAGVARADTLTAEETNPWQWYVRWFKPLEKEELRIAVNHRGEISRLDHRLPEGEEGANLEIENARPIAEAFLKEHFSLTVTDTTQYRRLEAQSRKREARTDHSFVWERIDKKVADGEFRLEATVHGDRVGSARKRYKAPEAFLRELRESHVKDTIPNILITLFGIATVILAGRYFLRAYKAVTVTWGFPIKVGILIVAVALMEKINDLPTFYQNYNTSQALATFLTREAIGLLGVVFIGLFLVLLTALLTALYRTQRPDDLQPPDWFALLKSAPAALWGQALFLALAWLLIERGTGAFTGYVHYTWLPESLKPGGFFPPSLNTYLPSLDVLLKAPIAVVPAIFLVLTCVLIWTRVLPNIRLILALLVLYFFLSDVVKPATDISHGAYLLGLALIRLPIRLFIIMRLIRFNLLPYIVIAWVSALLNRGWSLFQTPHSFYQANGVILLLFTLIPIVFALMAYMKERQKSN